MIRLKFFALGCALATTVFVAEASAKNCAKIYNDCRNALFSDKKSCTKKRDKCDAEIAQEQLAVVQTGTKSRMLNGQTQSGNGMRNWATAPQDENSPEAKKEAARRRILDRERESALAPQKTNMRDKVNSN
jgi:hypothetical protein